MLLACRQSAVLYPTHLRFAWRRERRGKVCRSEAERVRDRRSASEALKTARKNERRPRRRRKIRGRPRPIAGALLTHACPASEGEASALDPRHNRPVVVIRSSCQLIPVMPAPVPLAARVGEATRLHLSLRDILELAVVRAAAAHGRGPVGDAAGIARPATAAAIVVNVAAVGRTRQPAGWLRHPRRESRPLGSGGNCVTLVVSERITASGTRHVEPDTTQAAPHSR